MFLILDDVKRSRIGGVIYNVGDHLVLCVRGQLQGCGQRGLRDAD